MAENSTVSPEVSADVPLGRRRPEGNPAGVAAFSDAISTAQSKVEARVLIPSGYEVYLPYTDDTVYRAFARGREASEDTQSADERAGSEAGAAAKMSRTFTEMSTSEHAQFERRCRVAVPHILTNVRDEAEIAAGGAVAAVGVACPAAGGSSIRAPMRGADEALTGTERIPVAHANYRATNFMDAGVALGTMALAQYRFSTRALDPRHAAALHAAEVTAAPSETPQETDGGTASSCEGGQMTIGTRWTGEEAMRSNDPINPPGRIEAIAPRSTGLLEIDDCVALPPTSAARANNAAGFVQGEALSGAHLQVHRRSDGPKSAADSLEVPRSHVPASAAWPAPPATVEAEAEPVFNIADAFFRGAWEEVKEVPPQECPAGMSAQSRPEAIGMTGGHVAERAARSFKSVAPAGDGDMETAGGYLQSLQQASAVYGQTVELAEAARAMHNSVANRTAEQAAFGGATYLVHGVAPLFPDQTGASINTASPLQSAADRTQESSGQDAPDQRDVPSGGNAADGTLTQIYGNSDLSGPHDGADASPVSAAPADPLIGNPGGRSGSAKLSPGDGLQ
jgi:hypothetical protein